MNIHEYQSKLILSAYGIAVPNGFLIENIDDAERIARKIKTDFAVVKAQIHAGGRGKSGGVVVAKSIDDVIEASKKLLNQPLVTHQTGPEGEVVRKLYIEEGCHFKQEFYFSLILNREKACLTYILSKAGGMEIENVPKNEILFLNIDESIELDNESINQAVSFLNIDEKHIKRLMINTKKCLIEKEALMIEINPLVQTNTGELIALDAKLNFDDNALFRHPDIEGLRDDSNVNQLELEANDCGLAYIKLEGNIGCLVNGAGLAMATMDAISMVGGEAANFLDVGGSADVEKVTKGFDILLKDSNVQGIFVNIFGGIMKCDTIALGIVKALKHSNRKLPIVVRLEGNRADYGRFILEESEYLVEAVTTMDECAIKIVNHVKIGGEAYEYLDRRA